MAIPSPSLTASGPSLTSTLTSRKNSGSPPDLGLGRPSSPRFCWLQAVEVDRLPVAAVAQAVEDGRADAVADRTHRAVAHDRVEAAGVGRAELVAGDAVRRVALR